MIEHHNLFAEIYQEIVEKGLSSPAMLAQLTMVLFALLSAWMLERWVARHMNSFKLAGRRRIGQEGVVRVFFPLAALAMTTLGELILRNWFSPPLKLLNIVSVLLLAMSNIALLVFLLRQALANEEWARKIERPLALSIWGAYAMHALGILPELWVLLDTWQLHFGKSHFSVLDVVQGLFTIVVIILVSLWASRALERKVMHADVMDASSRVMAIKVMRAVLLILSVLIAMPLLGIDLTALSVFGGALGVGLGFGLQKIASNYVSGFIILMDRSVKIGDIVVVDERRGVVSQLTSRYIVLKGVDGNDALIPNETLITSTVVNQSYSDRMVRIGMPVQVAYSSDLPKVLALLLEAAKIEPRVVADPEPAAHVKNFGDSGIDVELGVWIADPENGMLSVRSAINIRIWQLFKENGIEIPFPQREVRLLGEK